MLKKVRSGDQGHQTVHGVVRTAQRDLSAAAGTVPPSEGGGGGGD